MYECVPQELKNCKHWLCYKLTPDKKGKLTKVPINPVTGYYGSSTNSHTWSDFQTAVRASENFDGIAFAFTDSPFFGIDVDKKEKELRDFLEGDSDNIIGEFVDALKSYTEISPSGKGIHIICRGSLPKAGRRVDPVEMYETGRFFTVTGHKIGEYSQINECTESVKPLYKKYLGEKQNKKPSPQPPRPCGGLRCLTDKEIIDKAASAQNGDKFVKLFSGDIKGYDSFSEASLALCNQLAFWTGCNAEMMDRLFRQSGLMREKWDERRPGGTWGAEQIQLAIRDCTSVYEPKNSGFRVNIGNAKSPQNNPQNQNSQQQKFYTMDDMGNAQRFIDLFGEDLKYNYAAKKWLCWNGKYWQTDEDGMIERLADSAVEKMRDEAEMYQQNGEDDLLKSFQKHIKNSRSNKSKNNMIKETCHKLPVIPKNLDTYLFAFNTPNGIISLKNGKIYPHERKFLITKISGCECAENDDCPIWKDFLNYIFNSDQDLINYIQKAVGYSLSGDISEQCFFILLGGGHNGKSTFLETLRSIINDYAANIQVETITVKNGFSHGINSDIARLAKKRFITASEPNEGVRLNEGLIKQFTGGEPVTARKLFENEIEFHPEFKLWIATNPKIIIRGTDDGMWRRVSIIPFSVRIPKEKADKELPNKLKKEYPTILRWAVNGCVRWFNEGLEMPKAVLDAVREYRNEMDVVSRFLDDKCEPSKDARIKASDLYEIYCVWCNENNEYIMSNTRFGVEVSKKFKKTHFSDGTYYIGIRQS